MSDDYYRDLKIMVAFSLAATVAASPLLFIISNVDGQSRGLIEGFAAGAGAYIGNRFIRKITRNPSANL
jgi:hypothetical protein